MNIHLKLFATAAVAVGAISIASAQNTATGSENQVQSAADRASDKTNRAADKTDAALDKSADKSADHSRDAARNAADKTQGSLDNNQAMDDKSLDAKGIRDTLSSATEAAIKGSFGDVVERFADADRDRLGKAMPSKDDLKSLDALTKSFRDDWKAKYNQEFDIEKDELVFNPSVRIMHGLYTPSDVRTASERIDSSSTEIKSTPSDSSAAPPTPAASDDRSTARKAADKTGEVVKEGGSVAKEAAERTGDVAKGVADKVRGDANRTMATVIIPASHGLPQITVPFKHELAGWKIDVPDNTDANTLRANLEKHLKMAQDEKAQWPADANEAYLAVAHHVLLGIFEGTPNVQGSEAQPAGATIRPSNAPATPGAAQ